MLGSNVVVLVVVGGVVVELRGLQSCLGPVWGERVRFSVERAPLRVSAVGNEKSKIKRIATSHARSVHACMFFKFSVEDEAQQRACTLCRGLW